MYRIDLDEKQIEFLAHAMRWLKVTGKDSESVKTAGEILRKVKEA